MSLKQRNTRPSIRNLQRNYKKQGGALTTRVTNAIGKMVGRFGTPISDMFFNPKSGNKDGKVYRMGHHYQTKQI